MYEHFSSIYKNLNRIGLIIICKRKENSNIVIICRPSIINNRKLEKNFALL